jgi:hypothetical protein
MIMQMTPAMSWTHLSRAIDEVACAPPLAIVSLLGFLGCFLSLSFIGVAARAVQIVLQSQRRPMRQSPIKAAFALMPAALESLPAVADH